MATVYQSVLAGGGGQANLQTKTVTAGTSNVTVNPDTGYDGMSQVTVEPTPSEVGAITAGTSQQTAIPTAGKYFSSVTVDPTPSQSKSATPTTSSQTITPDSGKLLSSVSVGAIPSQYIIPSGNKALSYTSNGSRTGIDVKDYETVSVNVNVPTGSVTGKSAFKCLLDAGTAGVNVDDNYDVLLVYSSVNISSYLTKDGTLVSGMSGWYSIASGKIWAYFKGSNTSGWAIKASNRGITVVGIKVLIS